MPTAFQSPMSKIYTQQWYLQYMIILLKLAYNYDSFATRNNI